MPHGVHNTRQTAFRLPEGLTERLKDAAKRLGETMTDIAARGIAAELDRLDGTTAAGDPRSRTEPAAGNCKHESMRMSKGICPDCNQPVGYKASTTEGQS